MWCQNVLKTRTIYNKPAIFASLQYLTNNNLNGVTLKNPSRRLFVSEASSSTIGSIVDQWSHRFESEGIPQPLDSIKHIVAHVTGTRRVSTISLFSYSLLIIHSVKKLFNQIHFTLHLFFQHIIFSIYLSQYLFGSK